MINAVHTTYTPRHTHTQISARVPVYVCARGREEVPDPEFDSLYKYIMATLVLLLKMVMIAVVTMVAYGYLTFCGHALCG